MDLLEDDRMFHQNELVGDEDAVYLFQCLVADACYQALHNAMNCKTKPFDGSWSFRYPGTIEYVSSSVEAK